MIEIPLLQGKTMYFQLLAGSFILNKNLIQALNLIFSITMTSWGTKPKVGEYYGKNVRSSSSISGWWT
jgi:hypothetical protein